MRDFTQVKSCQKVDERAEAGLTAQTLTTGVQETHQVSVEILLAVTNSEKEETRLID